jgi:hypothetical protein
LYEPASINSLFVPPPTGAFNDIVLCFNYVLQM